MVNQHKIEYDNQHTIEHDNVEVNHNNIITQIVDDKECKLEDMKEAPQEPCMYEAHIFKNEQVDQHVAIKLQQSQ